MPAAAARSVGAHEGRIGPVGGDDDARACGKSEREQQNDWAGFQSDPLRLVSSKMRLSSRTIWPGQTVRPEGRARWCSPSGCPAGATRQLPIPAELQRNQEGRHAQGWPISNRNAERATIRRVAKTLSDARLADRPQIYAPPPRKFHACQNIYCGLSPNIAIEVRRSRSGGEGTE
jgi:hypothetical protein